MPQWFGTASIPYRTIRHELGEFGTTSQPVHDTPVSSVRPQNNPRVPVNATEHTLRNVSRVCSVGYVAKHTAGICSVIFPPKISVRCCTAAMSY